MPRSYKSPEVHLKADPKYGSKLASKIINQLMLDGKKAKAQKIFYEAVETVAKKVGAEPEDVFTQVIENIKPRIEVRSKRVGGANYQVPVEVGPRRGRALAFRWVLEAARGRRGRPMRMALADELVAAYNREGGAMMKRENAHKQAEANKAFAHFAF